MKYKILTTNRFVKEFKKLDRYTQLMIKSWITKNLVSCEGPRAYGKALSANKKCLWRYRVGSYRIISEIQNEKLVGLALCVGHRLDIYEKYWSELLPLSEGLLVTRPFVCPATYDETTRWLIWSCCFLFFGCLFFIKTLK